MGVVMSLHLYRLAYLLTVLLCIMALSLNAQANGGLPDCAEDNRVAQTGNTLSEEAGDQLRRLHAESFLDRSGTISSDTIGSQVFDAAPCGGAYAAPLPTEALWLRFTIHNNHERAKTWTVTFAEVIFDEIVLFEQHTDGLVAVARDGRTVPPAQRANHALKTGLPLSVEPGTEREFYLRISGTLEPTITPVITSSTLFAEWSAFVLILSAAFLGYTLTIALFSIVVFRQIEARFYKFYTLYLACLFGFSFIYDGWFSHFVGVTLPVFMLSPISEFLAGLAVFASIQYCRILLRVGASQRRLELLFGLLSVVAVVTTSLAVLDPWTLSLPLHLIFFINPLILLGVSLMKIREGLPQAKPIALSLFIFSTGLFFAVYFQTFPMTIRQAGFAYELILLRPIAWGYYLAVAGETIFMMIAISTIVNSMRLQSQTAITDAVALRKDTAALESEQIKLQEITNARIEALEAILIDSPENNLLMSAEQRFLDRVTESVLDRVGDPDFGVKELAAALAMSERTLGRRLKKSHGLNSTNFIRSVRLNYARDLILMGQDRTVSEVAKAAGFSNISHFAKVYRQKFEETPSETARSVTPET